MNSAGAGIDDGVSMDDDVSIGMENPSRQACA